MTPEEDYRLREIEVLKSIPREFHAAISYLAYQRGHSYGWNEVLSELEELVAELSNAIELYGLRMAYGN